MVPFVFSFVLYQSCTIFETNLGNKTTEHPFIFCLSVLNLISKRHNL